MYNIIDDDRIAVVAILEERATGYKTVLVRHLGEGSMAEGEHGSFVTPAMSLAVAQPRPLLNTDRTGDIFCSFRIERKWLLRLAWHLAKEAVRGWFASLLERK